MMMRVMIIMAQWHCDSAKQNENDNDDDIDDHDDGDDDDWQGEYFETVVLEASLQEGAQPVRHDGCAAVPTGVMMSY